MIAIRSPSRMASAKSWVMKMIVRCSDLLQADQLVLHVAADQRVEGGERLVEEQHLGVERQGSGQAHPLLHATRKLLREVARPIGEPNLLEHRHGQRPPLDLPDLLHLEAVGDVVDHPPMGEQTEVLEHHRHPAATDVAELVGGHRQQILTVEAHLARGRFDQP